LLKFQYPPAVCCLEEFTAKDAKERAQRTQRFFLGFPSLPRIYNPGTAKLVLFKTAAAAVRELAAIKPAGKKSSRSAAKA
jgi:hypothetical protein